MMNRMKSGITAAAFVAAMGLAAPAEAQMHGNDQPYGSGHEMPTPDVVRPVSHDAAFASLYALSRISLVP